MVPALTLMDLDKAQLVVQSYSTVDETLWHFSEQPATQDTYDALFLKECLHPKAHSARQITIPLAESVEDGGKSSACVKTNKIITMIEIIFFISLFAIALLCKNIDNLLFFVKLNLKYMLNKPTSIYKHRVTYVMQKFTLYAHYYGKCIVGK